MKKVYVLINHFQVQDGVARTAIGMANALASQPGVEVTIQSLFRFDPEMKSWLQPGVQAKPFLGFYFRGLAKLVGKLPKKLLYRLLVRQDYDVEIGFCMTLPTQIIAASNRKTAKHYAWTHGYDTGLTLLDSYKKMDKVFTVSQCNEERFRRETGGTIAVQCCHNLVDDGKVRAMGQEPVDLERPQVPTFVAVGRLEPGKGIARLVECCGRLKQAGYRFVLWLIGDGEECQALERQVQTLDLTDTVRFLGSQRNPHAYTAKADMLVCASYGEGYSTACVEAIMLGVPVLSTDVGGAREIIADAQAGMVVEQDTQALYDGLKQVLDHPEQVAQWKQTLCQTKSVFSYENRVSELLRSVEL